MNYLIYRAICIEGGGCYIGITGRSMEVRRREHYRTRSGKQRNCVAFHAAILKYGHEAFQWEVLIDGLERDEAEHLERFLIATMKPRYNVAAGGLKGLGFVGSIRSPETIARMQEAAKKRGIHPDTHAARIEKQRKRVVCVETGTVFRDAAEAALAHGVKRSHVYDRLFKKRPSGIAMVTFRHALPQEIGMDNVRESR
jgi:group I intron endonuclease